jgi:hypothetical protein
MSFMNKIVIGLIITLVGFIFLSKCEKTSGWMNRMMEKASTFVPMNNRKKNTHIPNTGWEDIIKNKDIKYGEEWEEDMIPQTEEENQPPGAGERWTPLEV